MSSEKTEKEATLPTPLAAELIDLLPIAEKEEEFDTIVKSLRLSQALTGKIFAEQRAQQELAPRHHNHLEAEEENELATEALILRHQFTELVCNSLAFRQAAISVISNIYLFANRRIFFQAEANTEIERQQALLMVTTARPHIPLAKSFQHHILARIWNRICATHTPEYPKKDFQALTAIITKLNAIRNIYITLSMGFIYKMAHKAPPLYMQGIASEDAVQIASFGVARAAYRYHPSIGVRFSTFSAKWIQKEIQRQALQGRLIRISPYTVGRSKGQSVENAALQPPLLLADDDREAADNYNKNIEEQYDKKETLKIIEKFLATRLNAKSADILRRRYGLAPYCGKSQSVITIAEHYQVSRGSIYQLEQSSMRKLRSHLANLNKREPADKPEKV